MGERQLQLSSKELHCLWALRWISIECRVDQLFERSAEFWNHFRKKHATLKEHSFQQCHRSAILDFVGKPTGEQLEEIKADIKRALMLFDEPTLKDGLFSIGPIGYLGSTPLPREDGAATESVQCRFRVTYTEKFGDPNATR